MNWKSKLVAMIVLSFPCTLLGDVYIFIWSAFTTVAGIVFMWAKIAEDQDEQAERDREKYGFGPEWKRRP